jgi:2-keto-3-deoxy-6-phosphogluconate aldolase
VINEILRIGVVPVFYNADLETAKKVVEACAAAGYTFSDSGSAACH